MSALASSFPKPNGRRHHVHITGYDRNLPRNGWNCNQIFFSPDPPLSPLALRPQPNLVPASITHPDAILLSSLSFVAAATTSPGEDNSSLTACPPLSMITYNPLPTPVSSSSAKAYQALMDHQRHSSPTVTPPNDPAEYFSNEVGSNNPKRIGYLVQAAQGFISSNIERKTFTTILVLWSSACDGSGSKPSERLQRLDRGHDKTKHWFADLLYFIYFAHEVEQIAQSESVQVIKGKGQGRQTVAFLEAAKALGKNKKAVTADHRKSRNYRLLLRQGGPGSLLQIGSGVNALWQHRLIEDDIRILLKYRKDHLQDLDKQAHALDAFASKILSIGMVAFGWDCYKLAATRSDLRDSIQQHTDIQQLAQDMERLTITQALGELEVGEGPGASEDGNEKRKPCLPLNFEEPDITMMTGLLRMPGELDVSTMTWLLPTPRERDISMQQVTQYSQIYEDWA